jgi:branched-chain amino acid transport system ATP-binding protein
MIMPALEVKGLSRSFGGLKAVTDLSFKLRRGGVLGLLGPNGSGKTTALNLISGVSKPDRGAIILDGTDIAGQPSFRVARRGIARTFQLVRPFRSMLVRDNVEAGSAFTGARLFGPRAQSRIEELLAKVGLAGRGDMPASGLTYIDLKRLELARALAMQPRILLLDEWLAGLNPTELTDAIALVRQVQADGISIILVEHVLEAVRSLCDHCVVMNAGAEIAQGTPSDVLKHPEVVRAYLGDDHA